MKNIYIIWFCLWLLIENVMMQLHFEREIKQINHYNSLDWKIMNEKVIDLEHKPFFVINDRKDLESQ